MRKQQLEIESVKNASLIAFKPRQVILANSAAKPSTMSSSSKTLDSENGDNKSQLLLLESLCQYLERKGFAKALKKLCSEAGIEKDCWKSCSLDLEKLYQNYLESRNFANNECKSKKENEMDDTSKIGAVETVSKKKRGLVELSSIADKKEEPTNGAMLSTKLKEKKKSKKCSDENTDLGNSTELDNNCKEKKKKKKKSKTGDDVTEQYSEFSQEDKSNKLDSLQSKSGYELKTSNEPDNHKKKKQKQRSDAICGSEVKQVDAECPDSRAAVDASEVPIKEKEKKRKKEKSISNGSSGKNAEGNDQENSENNPGKDHQNTYNEGKNSIEKKKSKKRKNLDSEENEYLPSGEIADKESKRRKFESSEESRKGDQATKLDASLESNKCAGKESQTENGQGGLSQLTKTPAKKLDAVADGKIEENGEKSASQKSRKEHQSAEPKTVKAFQRVKDDEIKFADERLQDNSYWAKDGAENGYGAKAQEILGQVKGRDFRHEKTKKKRGSYRGGLIDLQSHSVKFADSDDE